MNIAGEIFETWESTLRRFPDTLLGKREIRRSYYCPKNGEYYFDRNRRCFEAILYFYQSNGSLNCPQGIPIAVFENECRYFRLPEKEIREMKRREGILFDLWPGDEISSNSPSALRVKLYNIIQNPETSSAAWIFGMFSLSVTSLSIIIACLDTMPQFHQHSHVWYEDYWSIIELILNTWFLTELFLRFSLSTEKLDFIRCAMNLIDIISVIPYFTLLAMHTHRVRIQGIFKTFRFIRLARLFRLSKHSKRLKVFGRIIQSSQHVLQLLSLCLVIVVCIGSTFMYSFEVLNNTEEFSSIPASFWWAITTLTSIGYGDMVPRSPLGRGFACGFMLFGALTISLPILTMVYECTLLYPKNVPSDTLYITKIESK